MKITFTRESIAAHIAACQSMEFEDGVCTYYLHMTDEQKMLPNFYDEDVQFKAIRDHEPYMAGIEGGDFFHFFHDETLSNEGFASMVDDLYVQALEYFENMGD